ncbi:MAG: hypothetical protein HFJ27_01640 [Clostridia bacterium]|nr:hypothetical protein [Clostridia bacterium]
MTSPKRAERNKMKPSEARQKKLEAEYEKILEEYGQLGFPIHIQRKLFYISAGSKKLHQLKETSETWTSFCEKICKEGTRERQVAKELIKRISWLKEVQFIWHEKMSNEELKALFKKSKVTFWPSDNAKEYIFFWGNKKAGRVVIHIG